MDDKKDAELARRRARYDANFESERARSREWYAVNRERKIAYSRKYYEENKEAVRERQNLNRRLARVRKQQAINRQDAMRAMETLAPADEG